MVVFSGSTFGGGVTSATGVPVGVPVLIAGVPEFVCDEVSVVSSPRFMIQMPMPAPATSTNTPPMMLPISRPLPPAFAAGRLAAGRGRPLPLRRGDSASKSSSLIRLAPPLAGGRVVIRSSDRAATADFAAAAVNVSWHFLQRIFLPSRSSVTG